MYFLGNKKKRKTKSKQKKIIGQRERDGRESAQKELSHFGRGARTGNHYGRRSGVRCGGFVRGGKYYLHANKRTMAGLCSTQIPTLAI